MKLGIEGMIQIFLFLAGFFCVFSVYIISMKILDAKQYHTWIIETLEGCEYADSVKMQCKKEAEKQGYQLCFEKENERNLTKIILKYSLFLPYSEENRQFQITGYSNERR